MYPGRAPLAAFRAGMAGALQDELAAVRARTPSRDTSDTQQRDYVLPLPRRNCRGRRLCVGRGSLLAWRPVRQIEEAANSPRPTRTQNRREMVPVGDKNP